MSECPECGMRDDDWFLCRRPVCGVIMTPASVDRIEALERDNAALRDNDAKMQLLHQQEDQLIAAERKVAELEADKARLSEARDDWENEAGEFAKEVDRLKCVIEEMEQERNSFDTHMEAVKRKYRNRAIEAERAARAALSGSGSGWRAMDTAPETGFFLAWSPDFPDMVSCWKAEIFHQARKPGTPRHLSANHFTLWRPLDLPAAPQQGGE